jgi:putative SOS response-associated peptidase YedK
MRLKALLALYPSEGVICWPVSARVGNVKNNDPSLIEPITGAALSTLDRPPRRKS